MTLWGPDPSSSSLTQQYTEEEKELEQKLLPYDILGNLAHVRMLEKQGYLEKEELEEVEKVLKKIYEKKPEVEAEDVHTFVEEKVTAETSAGKKMHTGRSRNDQVVLDTRLFMKDASIEVAEKGLELVKALEKFGEEENTLIPGYTHQQQAMPSSTGLWASSFADSLVDDLKLLKSTYEILDQNPLGAAAGYGTSLDIDREYTAELLGFSSVQENSLYCVNRGKPELMLLQILNQVMMDIGKMSEDIINFSEDQEIFQIPEEFTTGSSIMPQKENPDILEIARGKSEEVNAHQQALFGVISKLPSGYNRDTQLTKKHLFETVESVIETFEILKNLVSGLGVSENFELKDEVFAAYTANQMAENGAAFREAHHEVKENEEYVKNQELKQPRNQGYEGLESFWQDEKESFHEVKASLLGNSFETSRE
ncbi:MAG: argininosuccinate lyase [Candidatus Nanohalobium sp.]